jgi:hypothetical protein
MPKQFSNYNFPSQEVVSWTGQDCPYSINSSPVSTHYKPVFINFLAVTVWKFTFSTGSGQFKTQYKN